VNALNGLRSIHETTAVADNHPAMELKADLLEPRGARVLRGLGKRAGESQANKSDVIDSIRDFGPMPSPQRAIGGSTTPNAFQMREHSSRKSSFVIHDCRTCERRSI
jgi:hypothetical protein